jgi:hypothetical protein
MNESGDGVDYSWDRRRFSTHDEAVDHGFELRGSDDFNIALIEGDILTGFYWMPDPARGLPAPLSLSGAGIANWGEPHRARAVRRR